MDRIYGKAGVMDEDEKPGIFKGWVDAILFFIILAGVWVVVLILIWLTVKVFQGL